MKGLRAYGKCGGKRGIYRENFGAGTEDRNSLEVLGLEVRMSLTRILNKCCGIFWSWFTWLGVGTGGGHI